MGIDTMPPVVTWGLLLDFPSFFGNDILDEEFEISSNDIEQLLFEKGISLASGDAVIFYTGYSKLRAKDNARYLGNAPGIGLRAAN